ncbi:MAG: MFS transporter, partial [Anaerolineales bacterium]|nr:MFS transporter [Anaerolineales bacterium]
MRRKQLFTLFLCSLVQFTMGGSVAPLLPVYLARLGIDPAVSGFYFTLGFLAIAAGAYSAGWISDRFQRRRETIFVSALVGLPAMYLMGQVNQIIPLTILTLLTWFIGGLVVSTLSIIAGLFAEPHERGRVFGVIAAAQSGGGIIGGFASGAIVDRWDFATLFIFIASLELMLMGAVFLVEDKQMAITTEEQPAARLPFMTLSLWLLFIAFVLANAASSGTGLGRALYMNALGFSATAISTTGAIAGLVTLPLSFTLGWASDRLGRKSVLMAAFTVVVLGALVLVAASMLWQFWLSTALLAVVGTSMGVGTALVTDLAPPEARATAIA